MASNSYLDNYFKEKMQPDENYCYYFYTMTFASATKYIIFGAGAQLLNQHSIICFTNKRIIIIEMNPATGNLTENIGQIELSNVKKITVKKGLLKTKLLVTFCDESIMKIEPNNICIGLSNHKKNLTKLEELYK